MSNNSKSEILEILTELARLNAHKKENYRSQAFSNAVNALKKLPAEDFELEKFQTLPKIRGVGDSTKSIILEYLETGTVQRLNELKAEIAQEFIQPTNEANEDFDLTDDEYESAATEYFNVTELFKGLHGVGEITAGKWYNKGWRTLDDVRDNIDSLTNAQAVSLQYYDDLKLKIPHAEIVRFDNLLNLIFNNTVDYLICGSYRRQMPESGDIDILVKNHHPVNISYLTTLLKSYDIILGTLSQGDINYMGIIQSQFILENKGKNTKKIVFGGPARRLDIKIVDVESWPFATLHYTGPYQLNIAMRTAAISRGWLLSEYHLIDENDLEIPCQTERDIFAALEIPYLEPYQRI